MEEHEFKCNVCGGKMKMKRVKLFGQWEDIPECPRCMKSQD